MLNINELKPKRLSQDELDRYKATIVSFPSTAIYDDANDYLQPKQRAKLLGLVRNLKQLANPAGSFTTRLDLSTFDSVKWLNQALQDPGQLQNGAKLHDEDKEILREWLRLEIDRLADGLIATYGLSEEILAGLRLYPTLPSSPEFAGTSGINSAEIEAKSAVERPLNESSATLKAGITEQTENLLTPQQWFAQLDAKEKQEVQQRFAAWYPNECFSETPNAQQSFHYWAAYHASRQDVATVLRKKGLQPSPTLQAMGAFLTMDYFALTYNPYMGFWLTWHPFGVAGQILDDVWRFFTFGLSYASKEDAKIIPIILLAAGFTLITIVAGLALGYVLHTTLRLGAKLCHGVSPHKAMWHLFEMAAVGTLVAALLATTLPVLVASALELAVAPLWVTTFAAVSGAMIGAGFGPMLGKILGKQVDKLHQKLSPHYQKLVQRFGNPRKYQLSTAAKKAYANAGFNPMAIERLMRELGNIKNISPECQRTFVHLAGKREAINRAIHLLGRHPMADWRKPEDNLKAVERILQQHLPGRKNLSVDEGRFSLEIYDKNAQTIIYKDFNIRLDRGLCEAFQFHHSQKPLFSVRDVEAQTASRQNNLPGSRSQCQRNDKGFFAKPDTQDRTANFSLNRLRTASQF